MIEKLHCVCFNANGLTLAKLKNLLKTIRETPDIILIAEVKSKTAPALPGYTRWSNLESPTHGVVIYIILDLKVKSLIVAEHNNIGVSINGLPDLYIFCSYIPYSLKLAWRSQIDPVLSGISKYCSVNSPCLWFGDFNLLEHDNAYSEFLFLTSQFNLKIVEHDNIPTCRNVTRPDIALGKNFSGKFITQSKIPRSDHLPIFASLVPFDCKVVLALKREFVCNSSALTENVIDEIWSEMEIKKISSESNSCEEFFLRLELNFRALLIKFGVIKKACSSKAKINHAVHEKLTDTLKMSNIGKVLCKVSKIITSESSQFSFSDIIDGLNTAENLPLIKALDTHVFRHNRSDSAIIFPILEIRDVILNLDQSKSTGPSLINVKVLKRLPCSLLVFFSKWYSRLTIEKFPIFCRISKVTGISKPDGSVRPICIMPLVMKIYDRLLMNRIQPILLSKMPLFQAAYLPHRRGAEENLFILKTLSYKYNDLIFISTDFSKAFNTIPNCIIWKALNAFNVPADIRDAVFDALISFRAVDFSENNFADFSRGVKQGGIVSGLIFNAVMKPLSEKLNSLPLKSPCFINTTLICHLLFADDIFCVARCLPDAWLISSTILDWSKSNGLVLNQSKCKILTGYKTNNLWFESVLHVKYLGSKISYVDKKVEFSRLSSNDFLSYKLSPASKALDDFRLIRNLITSFNDGHYCLQICHLDLFCNCRTVDELYKLTKNKDKFWIKIISDFLKIPHNIKLSLNRITCEFGLSQARFGPALVKYTHNFHLYLLSLPAHNLSRLAYEAGHKGSAGLQKASIFYKSYPRTMVDKSPSFWLSANPKIRNLIAPILLGVHNNANHIHKSKILELCSSKKYQELKFYISVHKL